MTTNLDVLAEEHLRDGRVETGGRGTGAGTAAHGVWDHAARLARMCALSPYRRVAVENLWLCPGDTAIDLGCSSAQELRQLQSAVGIKGQVLAVESAEARIEQVSHWVSENQWSNVHIVRADLGEYQFPAEVGGILLAGAVDRVGDLDAVVRRTAASLRTGGRLVVLDTSLVGPRRISPADEPRGTATGPVCRLPLDLRLWRIVTRHLAPVLFRQRLFGTVFLVAGESM